ncbi:MAG: YHS domain-containing protein [Oculatellaceae cyanobacterium Prado106]|nr:YHS domain-containing protein [Oculatellaceae cyanobacterium Prado106]
MKTKPVMFVAIALLSASLVVGCTNLQKSESVTAQPAAQVSPTQAAQPASSPSQAAQSDPAQTPIYTDNQGVAIDGTDPVAYFFAQRPVPGNPEFSHTWMNATWHFSSAANRDLFAANPEQYAPQYGGFCAFAVANGYTASTVPEAWSIVDGKLYLNFDLGVRDRWEQDIPGNINKANQNWPAAASDFKG